MNEQSPVGLFPEEGPASPEATGQVQINERCRLLMSGTDRVVLVMGVPVAHFQKGDLAAEAHAMVSLVDLRHAQQNEVAQAFGCCDRTLRRYQRKFEDGGLAALGNPTGYPVGRPRLKPARIRQIERLKAEGFSNRRIAQRMGVDEKAIRKLLKRLGWQGESPQQPMLPGLEDADFKLSGADPDRNVRVPENQAVEALDGTGEIAGDADRKPSEAFSFSLDSDPRNRAMDRMLASRGLIADALPLFSPGTAVPGAGALLAIPGILASGVLDCATEVYGSLGPAFHGLRTTLVTFLLMSLLRIRRAEGLKEHSPEELGRILGLDRAMEVKTLRRKLARLAATGRAVEFGRATARRRVQARGFSLGFLYVDGHVRVYSGKQDLPKAHVARVHFALPATTDYFVNDQGGDPLFVVTAPANAGLTTMLPRMVAEAKGLIPGRRLTVVFDRGGYSFDLFRKLVADEVDILTYSKGAQTPLSGDAFSEQSFQSEGETCTYRLADDEVTLSEGLTLRRVTRLSDNGHQTHILTSRRDLPAAEVAFRMFERWRQENFFNLSYSAMTEK